eukprot:12650974-Alexandrium_andersonii.AAC.1
MSASVDSKPRKRGGAEVRIDGLRIATHIASSHGGSAPQDPTEKRLRRARQHFSPPPSDSARQMTPSPTDEALQGGD